MASGVFSTCRRISRKKKCTHVYRFPKKTNIQKVQTGGKYTGKYKVNKQHNVTEH